MRSLLSGMVDLCYVTVSCKEPISTAQFTILNFVEPCYLFALFLYYLFSELCQKKVDLNYFIQYRNGSIH